MRSRMARKALKKLKGRPPLYSRTVNPLVTSFHSCILPSAMKLPHWVEQKVEHMPATFTGQILIECWQGGVTRLDVKESMQAPKGVESRRVALTT